jgi:hypothetical protein
MPITVKNASSPQVITPDGGENRMAHAIKHHSITFEDYLNGERDVETHSRLLLGNATLLPNLRDVL